MLLSHFGDFACNAAANQFAVQSLRTISTFSIKSPWSLRGVSVKSQCMANPQQMGCEWISFNIKQTKNVRFRDKTASEIKEKKVLKN